MQRFLAGLSVVLNFRFGNKRELEYLILKIGTSPTQYIYIIYCYPVFLFLPHNPSSKNATKDYNTSLFYDHSRFCRK